MDDLAKNQHSPRFRYHSSLRCILCGVLLALMLRFPILVLQNALNGLQAFAQSVLPTLFPYMAFCQLTADALMRSSISPALPCALLGLLGGSPTGARLCADLYAHGLLSRRTLHLLCALCGTVSPIFITGTLQSWANSPRFGLCILLSHWGGAFLCALIVHAFSTEPRTALQLSSSERFPPLRLPDAITQSAQAMLSIGGCIALFSVLSAMPNAVFPSLSPDLHAVLHALSEMAGGSYALLLRPWSEMTRCCAVSACISFGGISILMQNLAHLHSVGIRASTLLRFRCMHALFAAALCRLIFPLM